MDINSKRFKSVDNIYSAFISKDGNVQNFLVDYYKDNFKKISNKTKKSAIGWFEATKTIEKNKEIKIVDTIKEVIECFIPKEKYGTVLVNKGLSKLGYKVNGAVLRIIPDYYIEKLGIIFEFDGPDHYTDPFKYQRDERKYSNLNSIELNGEPKILKIIRIPYYYQLTKDVAKYIFDKLIKHFSEDLQNLPKEGFYSDEKYFTAISKIYKNMFTGKPATLEHEVPGCGLHESEATPAQFCWQGLDKLLDDFEKTGDLKPPKSIEHQYMWSLKHWLRDIEKVGNDDRAWLVLPLKKEGSAWHERFMDRYKDNIKNRKEEYLQNVFSRDHDSIVRTMK